MAVQLSDRAIVDKKALAIKYLNMKMHKRPLYSKDTDVERYMGECWNGRQALSGNDIGSSNLSSPT